MLPTAFSRAEVFQAIVFLVAAPGFSMILDSFFQWDFGLNGLSVQQLFSGPQTDFLP